MDEHRTFRVRTDVGADGILNVPIKQTFETIDILSVKLTQKNAYKLYESDYGIVVGRVLANDGFGIPNAKISIFIPMENSDDGRRLQTLYNFSTTSTIGEDGKMYNLLPDFVDKACHQDVGSFYNKRMLLDNDDIIEVFEKYYKYTTTTNKSGDYIIYGVPTGTQLLHVDIDLSDIGILSQTPRDMTYKGFTGDLFESPTKFRKDANLNSLAQIKRQTKSVFVRPFWGDTTEDDESVSIVRCDINIDYKFEPTCIFMGSVVTDTGDESIGRNCRTTKDAGRMDKLTTGPGMIEMIRFNERGKIEQATVKGEKLIDDNGIWCYQIPMNLDYMKTDEFGNMVPSDDPSKGIATRAKVRFRISMDEVGWDGVAKKRARFLVPNNQELYFNENNGAVNENQYEFGSLTDDSDFRNLYWNCVYTVKSFIPRLQKSKNSSDRRFTGIKAVNRSGDNNPMPYNSLSGRMNFNYRILCLLLKLFIRIVYTVNAILTAIAWPAMKIYKFLKKIGIKLGSIRILNPLAKVFCSCENANHELNPEVVCPEGLTEEQCQQYLEENFDVDRQSHVCGEDEEPTGGLCHIFFKIYDKIGCGIGLDGLCSDGYTYYPGCISDIFEDYSTRDSVKREETPNNDVAQLFNCMENNLADENEVFSFNFANDWVNGVLYFPLWFRFVRKKKTYFFKQFTIAGVDKWCNSEKYGHRRLKLYKTCSMNRRVSDNELDEIPEEALLDGKKDRYYKVPEGTNVYIGYEVRETDESNCYGYKCIRSAASCISDLPGVIKQKETIAHEYVYYYAPGGVVKTKDSIWGSATTDRYVKMFSTDIVLLGSLHDCDLQGIPQFFKKLTPSTYSMPPSLVVNDGVEDPDYEGGEKLDDDNSSAPDVFIPGTEYTYQTGADWGNRGYRQCKGPDYSGGGSFPPEHFADGGLFYGLTCSNIYTKPKTCVNLERICEYGVSPDIAIPILESVGEARGGGVAVSEKNLLPDGYISYDDIFDHDGRTDFATMNSNNLRVRINPETGYEVYDFDPYYVDNFDGSLHELMRQTNCKCNNDHDAIRSNYYYNYSLENNNYGYSRFRYGHEITLLGYSSNRNGTKTNIPLPTLHGRIPFNNGIVSTKNSFYFYFGLKYGKTAIEKFFTDYFSPCDTDESEHTRIKTEMQPNSVCNDGDGYLLLTMYGIETPYSISFSAASDSDHDLYISGLEDERIYFGSLPNNVMPGTYTPVIDPNTHQPVFLENDIYNVEIINSENVVIESFEIDFTNGSATSEVTPVPFTYSNDVLYPATNTPTYDYVAQDDTRYDSNNNIYLGGYLYVSYPTNSVTGDDILDYRFEVEAVDMTDFPQTHGTQTGDVYNGFTFDCTGGHPSPSGCLFADEPNDRLFVIGVPKSNVDYRIRITELCDGELSGNVYETTVFFREKEPMKMFVNNIDYDIIKNFSDDLLDVNHIVGWLNMANFGPVLRTLNASDKPDFDQTPSFLFDIAVSLSKYTQQATVPAYNPAICNYNWPDDCLYDLSFFFPNCVLREYPTSTIPLPIATVNSPDFVIAVVTTQTPPGITVFVKSGNTYDPKTGIQLTQFIHQYYGHLSYDEQMNLITSLNPVISNRMDVSYNVRSAFYTKNEENGEYYMKIGFSNGVPTVRHYIIYTEEDNYGFPRSGSRIESVETVVPGLYSPTITTDYGNYDGANYGNYSKPYSRDGNRKNPYQYGIIDASNDAIPPHFSMNQNIPTNQFLVHMVDKPFGCEFESWLPMVNFPNMINPQEYNELTSCNGFVGIKLRNGIVRSFGSFSEATADHMPVFDECSLNVGETIGATFGNVIPGSVQSATLPFGHQWTQTEYESRPGTERISFTGDVTDFTIENYRIDRANGQEIGCTGSGQDNNFFPLLPEYNPSSSFVCSDGRERVQIPLYPESELVFVEGECVVWPHLTTSLQIVPLVKLSVTATNGFAPSNVFLFVDGTGQGQLEYPIKRYGVDEISTIHKLDLANSIMAWDNYQTIIQNNSGLASTDDNFVFEIPEYQANIGEKIYLIAVSGDGNAIKRTYALSHIIDTELLRVTSSTSSSVAINALNSGHPCYYATHYPFTYVVKDQNDNVAERGTYDNGHITGLPITITFQNPVWTATSKLSIIDISGVEHVVKVP